MLERDKWVDYAKGIGIILVVYGHVARGVANAGIKQDKTLYILIDSIVYSFHMPLFFFLSGLFFISSLKKRGPYLFFENKVSTLFYPYVVWSVLQGGTELILSNYTNGNITIVEVASLLWAPRAQFWFLYALFLVSLVGIVIYWQLPNKYYELILLCSAFIYMGQKFFLFIPLIGFVVHNFVFVALGITFFQKRKLFETYHSYLLPVSLVLFVAAQWYFHIKLGLFYTSQEHWLTLLLAIFSILFIISLSLFLSRFELTWLAFMGSSSLGIYVMHVLAGSGFRIILQKFFGIEDILTHLIGGTLISLLVPLAIIYIFGTRIQILFKLT